MAKLSYRRGTTYNITYNYTPPTGAPDGAKALFSAKTQIDDDPTDTVNAIMTPKNVVMTNNSCVITIKPNDVADTIDAAKNYFFDIKVLDANGDVWPGVSGTFELDVTATNRLTG